MGAKRDRDLFGNVGVRGQLEAPVAGKSGEQENGFHPGEGFTDALAGTAPERKESEFRSGSGLVGQPAVGVESFGIVIPALGVMKRHLRKEHGVALAHEKGPDVVVLDCHSGEARHSGTNPHGFGNHPARVV